MANLLARVGKTAFFDHLTNTATMGAARRTHIDDLIRRAGELQEEFPRTFEELSGVHIVDDIPGVPKGLGSGLDIPRGTVLSDPDKPGLRQLFLHSGLTEGVSRDPGRTVLGTHVQGFDKVFEHEFGHVINFRADNILNTARKAIPMTSNLETIVRRAATAENYNPTGTLVSMGEDFAATYSRALQSTYAGTNRWEAFAELFAFRKMRPDSVSGQAAVGAMRRVAEEGYAPSIQDVLRIDPKEFQQQALQAAVRPASGRTANTANRDIAKQVIRANNTRI